MRRQAAWEAAVPKANEAYLRAQNLERATKQIELWSQAGEIRAYAAAIEAAVPTMADEDQGGALEWASWLQLQADALDPTRQPANLRWDPSPGREWDVSKFMPNGWSVSHPPSSPSYRWR